MFLGPSAIDSFVENIDILKKKRNYKWCTQTIWIFTGNGEAGRVGIFTEMTLYSARIEIVYFQAFHYSKKWVVSKALFYQIIFQQMFFVSCCESSEWQPTTENDKKKRQEYNILDVIFQKLLTQNVLHESSISKCACIKEIIHQQRYLNQNLTESHLNIKWQKTCLMSGMKNGWHLFMIFSFYIGHFPRFKLGK